MELVVIIFSSIIIALLIYLIIKINSNRESQNNISITLDNILKEQTNNKIDLIKVNSESIEKVLSKNAEAQEKMHDLLDKKLDKMQGIVSEKLDKSLNERLDSNFKQIGDQLGNLYESLGELNKLSTGVTSLNKTLSNVKSRGIFGEQQLRNILQQTMAQNQYDENVATKKNSNDRVEFAIKIPNKEENKEFIYLPIDSKFSTDIYNRIVDASEKMDPVALKSATKELENRIKTEARTIRDKYIDVPNTTNFAIMFLPTEGLYAEILRIDGLSEFCQTNCNVVISGPTTITALLNSLQLGFSNMALNKKSKDVLKLLQAIKTQYTNLDELISNTQKKLEEALSSTDKLRNRSDVIQRKMAKISEIDMDEAEKLLEEE